MSGSGWPVGLSMIEANVRKEFLCQDSPCGVVGLARSRMWKRQKRKEIAAISRSVPES
jgi:hypothetical protein